VKCVSLTQPWASLVASGAKKIETRSWRTSYRGLLAIAASKGFPRADREVCDDEPFAEALALAGCTSWRDLPRGAIVAVCRLDACVPTTLSNGGRNVTWHSGGWHVGDTWLSSTEYMFGDYAPNRYVWLLDDVRMLPAPIPCRGALGLWTVPAEITARIEEQIGVRV